MTNVMSEQRKGPMHLPSQRVSHVISVPVSQATRRPTAAARVAAEILAVSMQFIKEGELDVGGFGSEGSPKL